MSGWRAPNSKEVSMTLVGNDQRVVGLVEAHVKAVEEEISYRTAEIMHVEHGKVTERWSFSDDTQAIIESSARGG
jgi:ketosteroid isomerase-like protein